MLVGWLIKIGLETKDIFQTNPAFSKNLLCTGIIWGVEVSLEPHTNSSSPPLGGRGVVAQNLQPEELGSDFTWDTYSYTGASHLCHSNQQAFIKYLLYVRHCANCLSTSSNNDNDDSNNNNNFFTSVPMMILKFWN